MTPKDGKKKRKEKKARCFEFLFIPIFLSWFSVMNLFPNSSLALYLDAAFRNYLSFPWTSRIVMRCPIYVLPRLFQKHLTQVHSNYYPGAKNLWACISRESADGAWVREIFLLLLLYWSIFSIILLYSKACTKYGMLRDGETQSHDKDCLCSHSPAALRIHLLGLGKWRQLSVSLLELNK